MFKILISLLKSFYSVIETCTEQLKEQYIYEIQNVTYCPKKKGHVIEVKITGKPQGFSCLVEKIVGDDDFIKGFSPSDVRTITSFAITDKYEKILEKEKIKKSYDLIWSRNISGEKTIQFKHRITNEIIEVSLKSFADLNVIEKLESQDAYNLGYQAGQEQLWKDLSKLKIIANRVNPSDENLF